MELIATLRRIRACEGEVAAQLLLECLIAQHVSAEKERCATICDDSNIFEYDDPGGFFARLIRGLGA